MSLQKVLFPLAAVAVLIMGYQSWGWPGVVGLSGAVLMVLLLHFTQAMNVMRRAASRPIGYVDSAIMLNAKLKPRMTLMHVIAMTRSLGELQSPQNTQPEVYRWRDNGQSHVEATFADGRLVQWALTRPAPAHEAPAQQAAPAPADTPAP